MAHLHVDALAGTAGDMLLAALLDAGASLEAITAAVTLVTGGAVRLDAERVQRGSLRALLLRVDADPEPPARSWADIRTTLEQAALPAAVREQALAVFAALATAEAAVHGMPVEEVHFHEVGGLDALADVVGVCAALHDLSEPSVSCTQVAVGWGSGRSLHGPLPLPAPAVIGLLAAAGAPTYGGAVAHEACTPTGAALLATIVSAWGPQPPMTVRRVGVGAGGRDTTEVANVTRVLLGEPVDAVGVPGGMGAIAIANESDSSDEPWVVLETNVDDLDPRLWPGVLDVLLGAGAADAWLTPILMKKGRPAHTLSVLCAVTKAEVLGRLVLTHTSALGLRRQQVTKVALDRELHSVDVNGHAVTIKVARLAGEVVNTQPEWRDVEAAAAALGVPAKLVLARAIAAAHALTRAGNR